MTRTPLLQPKAEEALDQLPNNRFIAVFYDWACGHHHRTREAAERCGSRTWPSYGGTVWGGPIDA